MRKDDSLGNDELLINTNAQIKENVECGQCRRKTTCMRTLIKDLSKKQNHKSLNSIEDIVNLLFVRTFVCPDCVTAFRRQFIIDSFVGADISDNQVRDISEIMGRTPTKKAKFEFTVKTGEISKEVAKSYVVNTQQYGFQISCRTVTQARGSQNTRTTLQKSGSSQCQTAEEDETTESSDEETDEADESQDLSDLSNPSNHTIIDDVNELLAES